MKRVLNIEVSWTPEGHYTYEQKSDNPACLRIFNKKGKLMGTVKAPYSVGELVDFGEYERRVKGITMLTKKDKLYWRFQLGA